MFHNLIIRMHHLWPMTNVWGDKNQSIYSNISMHMVHHTGVQTSCSVKIHFA